MRNGISFDAPHHTVPCRVLVRGGQPPWEMAAEAVRLDRKGAVIRLANASQSLALEADTEILVSFELPRNPFLPCRLLCFSATVRHVSMADGRSGFMGGFLPGSGHLPGNRLLSPVALTACASTHPEEMDS